MFDSHFHLTDPRLNTLVKIDHNLQGVEVGADFETLPEVFAFALKHPRIFCTAGVHPAYADHYSQNDLENFIVSNLNNPKFVAIGECGLDYHRPDLPARERQIEVFISQIMLANQYAKPLVVHSRDAWDDTAAVLIAHQDQLSHGVLIHCMSYTAEQAQYLLDKLPNIPLYFAFGGHITHQSKFFLHNTLRVIPRERILIETDVPYLAPTPKRGEVNRPEFIYYTARQMAQILNLTVDEVEQLTADNAHCFFKI